MQRVSLKFQSFGYFCVCSKTPTHISIWYGDMKLCFIHISTHLSKRCMNYTDRQTHTIYFSIFFRILVYFFSLSLSSHSLSLVNKFVNKHFSSSLYSSLVFHVILLFHLSQLIYHNFRRCFDVYLDALLLTIPTMRLNIESKGKNSVPWK